MFSLRHPHEYQGLLKAKFEKAARRTKRDDPRIFKSPLDFANHVVRACNSGVLLHAIVGDVLGVTEIKRIHQKLRSIKDTQINNYVQKIMDAHKRPDWNYFELTHQDRPEPVPERKIKAIKLNAK